jgi:hypothetical protein
VTQVRFTQIAVLSVLGLTAAYTDLSGSIAFAQDDDSSGPSLTIGFDSRLEWDSNAGLDPDPAGGTLQSNTSLSFALQDETAATAFSLTGSSGLRIADGPGTDGPETTMADPRIALAYARIGATSRLDLITGLQINDIAYLRPLTDFAGPDGTIILPSDFDDLQGSGTRQSLNFDVKLSLREDAPFGLVLAAGVTDLRYSDVTNVDLIDNTRSYASATARLDITPVMQASVGLTYSVYDDADETNHTVGLNSGLTITRPDGALRFTLGLEDTGDGVRTSIGAGRDFETPNGGFSFDLGAVRTADGAVNLTGGAAVNHEFASGSASASLQQSITSGSNDAEALQTSLSLGLSREISPLASLNLGLSYVVSRDTATDLSTDTASLSASMGYALSSDWNLNVGYRYESRDEDGVGQAQNNVVFLGLSRDFEFPL